MIVPHMGWNEISFKASSLFKGIPDRSYFYFANSYYCDITEKGTVLSTTKYGIDFPSACRRENIWGVQFHPEKSQKLGLKLFNNFLTLC
jgi:glutamine amidotransferase